MSFERSQVFRLITRTCLIVNRNGEEQANASPNGLQVGW